MAPVGATGLFVFTKVRMEGLRAGREPEGTAKAQRAAKVRGVRFAKLCVTQRLRGKPLLLTSLLTLYKWITSS